MTTETVETVEQPSITIPDVTNALRIIDVAAERGAFRGPELSQVGSVRDRIAAFLDAVSAQQAATEETTESETTTEVVAEEVKTKEPARKSNRKR